MFLIAAGHQVGFNDNADVRCVELVVDDRSVADKAPHADIPLNKGRQAIVAAARIELKLLEGGVGVKGLARQHLHIDVAFRQSLGAQRGWREVVMIQIGQGHFQRLGIRSR